jgi:hypothetical protein
MISISTMPTTVLFGLQLLLSALVAFAAPAPTALQERAVTTLSAAQLDAFTPYTQFASAAYCMSSIIQSWTCGGACTAIPGFEVALTGGDGNGVQLCGFCR